MTQEELDNLHRRFRWFRRRDDGDKLLKHHHGFAVQIARRYVGPHLSYDDAVATALLGLFEALKRYEPKQGAFTTFSYWWILKALLNERTFAKNVVRLPVAVVRHSRKIQKLMAMGLTDEQIAQELALTVEEVRAYAEVHLQPTGSGLVDTEGEQMDVAAPDDVHENAERDSMKEELNRAINLLSKRAQIIVKGRLQAEPRTFTDLGRQCKISRQRAIDIYDESIETIKFFFRKQ